MKWFLFVMSLIWIAVGCCAILYPNETRNVVRRLIKPTDQKIISTLPVIGGILFLFSASASYHPWFIRIIGLIAVMKGIFIFANPKNMYHKLADWYLTSVSDQTNRLFGMITLMLGTAMLSWIL